MFSVPPLCSEQRNEKKAAEEMEFEDESEAAADFQETPVSEV